MIALLLTRSHYFTLLWSRRISTTRPKTQSKHCPLLLVSFSFVSFRIILMALVLPNIGKQVRSPTSSRVGPNSPQATRVVCVLILQREIKNSKSSYLLYIRIVCYSQGIPNACLGYLLRYRFDKSLVTQ